MQFFSNALGIGRTMVLCINAERVNPYKARPMTGRQPTHNREEKSGQI